MKRTFILVLIVSWTVSASAQWDTLFADLTLDIQIRTNNTAHVTETYYFHSDFNTEYFSRNFYFDAIDGRFPLMQRVENMSWQYNDKELTDYKTYSYGRERQIFTLADPNLKDSLTISYDYYYPTDFQKQKDVVELDLRLYFLNDLFIKKATYRIHLDEQLNMIDWTAKLAWEEKTVQGAKDKNYYEIQFDEFSAEGVVEPKLINTISLERNVIERGTWASFFEEWKYQGDFVLYLFLILLVLAILIRFLPPTTYIWAIRFYEAVIAVLMIIKGREFYRYFRNTDVLSDFPHFWSEFLIQWAFVIIFVIFAKMLDDEIRKGGRDAYFMGVSLAAITIINVPYIFSNPQYLLLILMGYLPLIFWFQRKNARYYGVYYNRIFEILDVEGKISFENLSKRLHLPVKRLISIVQKIPNHPVLINHQEGKFYAASALQTEENYELCNNCGATEILTKGENRYECAYCNQNYHDTRNKYFATKEALLPIPLEVASKTIYAFIIVPITLIIAIVIAGFIEDVLLSQSDEMGTFIAISILFLIIGAVIIFPIIGMSEALKKGKNYRLSLWVLGVTSFLIVPLFTLFKMRSKRILLHFNKIKYDEIASYIKEKGSLKINDFAEYLNTNTSEALEIVYFLSGNNLVPIVYDVTTNQIVDEDLWATWSKDNSCTSCGGITKVVKEKIVCSYCGQE